eukprot:TRINITY_DN30064_c0_g1_i1.p1 TRINITY_DN30064_c0_g1~~TRINITY_DN30064_c0_g1_i1.p1  ORF type:complete len:685 (+),score=134.39 TRINITY_DN30064_c0_g1_i1:79-2133(+)
MAACVWYIVSVAFFAAMVFVVRDPEISRTPSVALAVFLVYYALGRFIKNRRSVQRWLHSWPKVVTLLSQPYSILQLGLLAALGWVCANFYFVAREFEWLNPETFVFPPGNDEIARMCALTPQMRALCVSALGSMVVAFFISLVTLKSHIPPDRKFETSLRFFPSNSHDLAMQVVVLPQLYGVLALDSMVQMLNLLTGHSYVLAKAGSNETALELWDRVAHEQTTRYSTGLEIADLYEAWALWCFSVLCIQRVRRQIRDENAVLLDVWPRLREMAARLRSVLPGGMEEERILADEATLLAAEDETLVMQRVDEIDSAELLQKLGEEWSKRGKHEFASAAFKRALQLSGDAPHAAIDLPCRRVRARRAFVSTAKALDDILQESETRLSIMNRVSQALFKPLEVTTLLGIRVFVLTYAAKSIYLLALAVLQIDCQDSKSNGDMLCAPSSYLNGAGFLASSVAIYNIVIFEHSMSEILKERRFKPTRKFLCVKALVSIAFFQSFVLSQIFSRIYHFPSEQADLVYSCLLCIEVLPLSILHYFAWRPEAADDWYADDRLKGRLRRDQRSGQLAGEESDHEVVRDEEELRGEEASAVANVEVRGPRAQAVAEQMVNLMGVVGRCTSRIAPPAASSANLPPPLESNLTRKDAYGTSSQRTRLPSVTSCTSAGTMTSSSAQCPFLERADDAA